MTETTIEDHHRLVQALRDPARYPHETGEIRVIETHISSVILTGPYAYKLKKPLDFGFLDFTTLARRKHFCEEEIRLNTRLAPSIYLDVTPVTGTLDDPRAGGDGEPLEYAVRMRQFSQDDLLDRRLAAGDLPEGIFEAIAERVARFHGEAAVAPEGSDFGTPEAVLAPVQQNFDQIRPLLDDPSALAQLERLEHWSREAFGRLRETFARRRDEGRIRECHGDMHLGNMALIDGEVAIFDGIEFNEHFRWIDVMSEIAFLVMDLDDRGQTRHARRLLNRYLEVTGDYDGLAALGFYRVYRAMVRAKIASLRLTQPLSEAEREETLRAYRSYADLAERYTHPPRPVLCITHGVSGSGKTTVAGLAVERYGFVRLRSDIERKRLHGLDAAARTGSTLGGGIYGEEATRATYQRLADLAERTLAAGFPALADATFLEGWQRDRFRDLAERLGVAFVILDIQAPLPVLRRWLAERAETGSDASEADQRVLESQLESRQPLTGQERSLARQVQAEHPDIEAALGPLLAERRPAPGTPGPG